jgi:hypothetical protein
LSEVACVTQLDGKGLTGLAGRGRGLLHVK